MSKIQDIARLLHSEGRAEGREHFTIDRTQAREKMRQFQLADPHEYILKLVQAAVRNGATQIRFNIDSDDMWMHFDGAGFTLVDFENLYGSIFARSDDDDTQALRYLALGLNAATALNPRHIDIASGDAKMRIRPGVDDDWRPADEPISGTRIHLKERFRPGLVIQFVRNLTGNLTEAKILEVYCRFSPVDINIGDRPISKGFQLDDSERQVELDIRGGRALMGLVQARKGSAAEFIVDGVLIASCALKLAPGIRVLVRSDRVRTDLSAQKLVRNSDFHSLIRELELAQERDDGTDRRLEPLGRLSRRDDLALDSRLE
ncbi:MAG: hypothetical protein JRG94_13335 [Deltaproteobacteria bacterium]|nr:hypothetical protein [Deltaproteobacteria bacterium]